MLAQSLDDEPLELPLAALDLHRVVLVQIEFLALVVELAAERDLPLRRDPIGADFPAKLPLAARFLAVERRRPAQAEHPVVPAIPRNRRPGFFRSEPDRDRELRGHSRLRHIVQQPDAQHRPDLTADDIVRIPLSRERFQRVIHASQAAAADEARRVLAAGAARFGARDEDVHISLGAIAHVVYERDLRAEEILKTVLTVEKDLHLSGRRVRLCLLSRVRPSHERQTDHDHRKSSQCHHHVSC
jgi:hypothetical protein